MTDLSFSLGQFPTYVSGLALIAAACVTSILLYGAYNIFLHPLRAYPGPKLWAAYRFPWVRSVLSGRYHLDALELHKKYGPVVRVAPCELSYADPAAWKPIYSHHNPATEGFSEFGKDHMIYQKPPNGIHSILAAEQADHGRYRRFLSHSFSEKGLREMQPRIQRYVDLLVQGLHERCGEGDQNILEWYNWTTFDLTGDLAFGESFHCLERQETDPWISFIFNNIKAQMVIGSIRRYGLAKWISFFIPKSVIEARESNYRRTTDKIEQRIKQGTGRGDFWDTVIKKSDFEKGTGMTREEMVSNASVLVLAGSETTATLLSGTTYLLLTHPEVYRKLNEEVRGAFKSEEEINLLSVNKLTYMLAVLDEAMRVYPPVPHQGNRVVPAPGAIVCGRWVPGGTSLGVLRYVITRLPPYFTRPEEFIPERWVPSPPPEFANDDRSAPQSFALGPRNCIGRNLAYAEMRLILAKVCWNFDMELNKERSGGWTERQKVFGLWEKVPLWVRLRPVQR
ncbi:benzoate 4-monooxygenase cytochrome P450 [Delitschia confertaspora ATCC 74209]|uniref:Benzoate 4-monooxygenase cytochrome P450 n=1 Tax=Delitschia confertaspora ATCC 74209 TaxID=1513339 RepID=A0A9P4MYY2_9PLEO|nr:benzoate 4-monooxygenase cytochrome P450 [Delitschia confertaspora ATCC 74209]